MLFFIVVPFLRFILIIMIEKNQINPRNYVLYEIHFSLNTNIADI
jgi:hypothetical protein